MRDGRSPGTPPPGGAREPSRPARQPLSRQLIIEGALRLVDAESLEALTMRRLGAELGGFEAMSLYHYVTGKADVLDGVLATVWAEMELPAEGLSCWERLAELARSWRGLARAHPGVLPLLANRANYAPTALRAVESALGALREAGFEGPGLARAFRTLLAYVYGQASLEILRSGDQGWGPEPWYDLSRVPAECPLIGEAAAQFTRPDDASFEWGLQATLDGLRAGLVTPKFVRDSGLRPRGGRRQRV